MWKSKRKEKNRKEKEPLWFALTMSLSDVPRARACWRTQGSCATPVAPSAATVTRRKRRRGWDVASAIDVTPSSTSPSLDSRVGNFVHLTWHKTTCHMTVLGMGLCLCHRCHTISPLTLLYIPAFLISIKFRRRSIPPVPLQLFQLQSGTEFRSSREKWPTILPSMSRQGEPRPAYRWLC